LKVAKSILPGNFWPIRATTRILATKSGGMHVSIRSPRLE
jgi:hypothetical protein